MFSFSVTHLHSVDVAAAHAAAAIHEEEQLPGGFVQLQRLPQQVGAEVEHQDGAAQDVLVESLPHELQLQRRWNVLRSAVAPLSWQSECERPPTFLSGSESLRVQRVKSRREQICSSYWPNESRPRSRMTSGL